MSVTHQATWFKRFSTIVTAILYMKISASRGSVNIMSNKSKQMIMKAHKELQLEFWISVEESHGVQRGLMNILEFEGEHYIEKADLFDVNSRSTREDSRGCTPLWMCVYHRNRNAVEFLLNGHGVDVHVTSNTSETSEMTPLHVAAKYQSIEIMKTLLHSVADTFAIDSRGKTALHYICTIYRNSRPKLILKAIYSLLQHTGPDPTGHAPGDRWKSSLVCLKDSRNKSAFHYAFAGYEPNWPHVHILDLLIDNGADINEGYLHNSITGMQDRQGRCMLSGHEPLYYKAIKLLLMGGADPFKIYKVHSATALAGNLKPDLHPACDNLINMFQAIRAVADEHGESGTNRHISINELETIIEDVEIRNKDCNSWGRRLDPGELHPSDQWW